MNTFNKADQAVADFLGSIGILYNPVYVGNFDHNTEWKHDLFSVSFNDKVKPLIITEFMTGIGYRDQRSKFSMSFVTKLKNSINNNYCLNCVNSGAPKSFQRYVAAPTSASVLYSLLSDASCVEYGFLDFCDNLGYSNDSIKALDMFKACEVTARDLKKAFTSEQLETLNELLQGY
jgi:hypothetical protein